MPQINNPKPGADYPDPNSITIQQATFSGNGCPQGTVSTSISSDKSVSSLLRPVLEPLPCATLLLFVAETLLEVLWLL